MSSALLKCPCWEDQEIQAVLCNCVWASWAVGSKQRLEHRCQITDQGIRAREPRLRNPAWLSCAMLLAGLTVNGRRPVGVREYLNRNSLWQEDDKSWCPSEQDPRRPTGYIKDIIIYILLRQKFSLFLYWATHVGWFSLEQHKCINVIPAKTNKPALCPQIICHGIFQAFNNNNNNDKEIKDLSQKKSCH